jgi:hypothetical protein
MSLREEREVEGRRERKRERELGLGKGGRGSRVLQGNEGFGPHLFT